MSDYNPYEVMEAHRCMTDAEIKALFMELAREHHPDRGGHPATMAQINQAYTDIKTADKRKKLDELNAFTKAECGACKKKGCTTRRTKRGKQTLMCMECGGSGFVPRRVK